MKYVINNSLVFIIFEVYGFGIKLANKSERIIVWGIIL